MAKLNVKKVGLNGLVIFSSLVVVQHGSRSLWTVS